MDERTEKDIRGLRDPMCYVIKEVVRLGTDMLCKGCTSRKDWDKINSLFEIFADEFKQTEDGKRWLKEEQLNSEYNQIGDR